MENLLHLLEKNMQKLHKHFILEKSIKYFVKYTKVQKLLPTDSGLW